MKKTWLYITAIILILSLFAGCGGAGDGGGSAKAGSGNAGTSSGAGTSAGSSSGSAGAGAATTAPAAKTGNPLNTRGDLSGGKFKVGIEVQTLTTARPVHHAEVLKEFWLANGADEVLITANENDVNREISNIEAYITGGCTVIAIVPNSYEPIYDVVERAKEAGCVVVINAPKWRCNSTIGENFVNEAYGLAIGRAAGAWLKANGLEKDEIAMDHGALSKEELVERYEGARKGILEYCPDIKIVSETLSELPVDAANNAETVLNAYPNLRAMVYNAFSGTPQCEMAVAMGFNRSNFGLFCGFLGESSFNYLADYECYRAMVDFGSDDVKLLSHREGLKKLKGEPYIDETIYDAFRVITKENMDKEYPNWREKVAAKKAAAK